MDGFRLWIGLRLLHDRNGIGAKLLEMLSFDAEKDNCAGDDGIRYTHRTGSRPAGL